MQVTFAEDALDQLEERLAHEKTKDIVAFDLINKLQAVCDDSFSNLHNLREKRDQLIQKKGTYQLNSM